MRFLKINIKVLLILCLFSGILFLSSGCGENNNNNNDDGEVNQPTNNNTDNSDNSQINENKIEDNTNNVSLNNTTDYSIWVANTTINTDKDQKSYKVIWGDTLWLISTAWEVPYKQIAAYNNIPNPDLIYVDQIIYNPIYK